MKSVAQVLYRRLRATSAPFSPLSLFAASEPGGWYDPSDLTTLYQDAAGTTPVTAVEQPVGLVLDKSKGLVLGSELVTNGDFSNGTTGWTLAGAWSVSAGVASIVAAPAAANLSQVNALPAAGRYAQITFTVNAGSTGTLSVFVGASASEYIISLSGARTYTLNLPVVGVNNLFFQAKVGATVYLDNISVRELPGSHLSQSTAAARPVLSSRVNLLTYTEQFDNAAWTKAAVTVSTDQTTAPDGTSTADLLSETITTSTHQIFPTVSMTAGVAYTAVFHLKKGPGATAPNWVRLAFRSGAMTTAPWANFNINTGTIGNTSGVGITASITGLANDWYRCAVTATADATSVGGGGFVQLTNNTDTTTSTGLNTYAGTTTSNIYIWGADLRPANAGVGLPAYQRVGAATDYDTTGFPLYLKFDGTDDFLQSSTITPGSVDKAQVFAGVRKVTDSAAYQVIAESSYSVDANNGSFVLATNVGTYEIFSKGTVRANAPASGYSAPITNVVASLLDISGDLTTLRVNGGQVAQSTADQGTGNFGSYPLYVGSRAGTSLRFNGHLYSLILRFSATNLDAATITATETWVNGKTKAF